MPGGRVTGLEDLYDRIVGLLHEAAFDDAGWPDTAAPIAAATRRKKTTVCCAAVPSDS